MDSKVVRVFFPLVRFYSLCVTTIQNEIIEHGKGVKEFTMLNWGTVLTISIFHQYA